jgi:DNA-binding LytR/AlgR family response regulator
MQPKGRPSTRERGLAVRVIPIAMADLPPPPLPGVFSPGRLRAVLATHDPALRARLRSQLARVWPQLEVAAPEFAPAGGPTVGAAATGEAAQLAGAAIVLLDTGIPGGRSLQIARAANGRSHLVFVIDDDARAVRALESGDFDFMLKPVSAERVFATAYLLQARLLAPPRRVDPLLEPDCAAALFRGPSP